MSEEPIQRRAVLSLIGSGGNISAAVEKVAIELGQRAMEAGFRLTTGGLDGVMAAASRGARSSPFWEEGRIVGIIPSYDRTTANDWCDIVLPTGAQLARNIFVVSMADVVVALAGGAGTLSEIAMAWQIGKPIIALDIGGGWAEALAETKIDHRNKHGIIQRAGSAEEAIRLALIETQQSRQEPGNINSGWRSA